MQPFVMVLRSIRLENFVKQIFYYGEFMDLKWIDPKLRMPPQGKKILYFDHGDIYIVQRFGKYWFPIPFYDSKFSKDIYKKEPQYWAEFNFPEKYTGKMKIKRRSENETIDMDDFCKKYPEDFKEFIDAQANLIENGNN